MRGEKRQPTLEDSADRASSDGNIVEYLGHLKNLNRPPTRAEIDRFKNLLDDDNFCEHGKEPWLCRDCHKEKERIEKEQENDARKKEIHTIDTLIDTIFMYWPTENMSQKEAEAMYSLSSLSTEDFKINDDRESTCPHNIYPSNTCKDCVENAKKDMSQLRKNFIEELDELDLQREKDREKYGSYTIHDQIGYNMDVVRLVDETKKQLMQIHMRFFDQK